MGTNASTRIQNESDYIELHTRVWAEADNIKSQLKFQETYWQRFVNSLQEDIINSNYDFSSLINWAQDFENFLKINDHFPSIEHAAAMMSMQSFVGHHVMPFYSKQSKQLLDFWGYNNPDVIANLKGHNFTFSAKKKNFKLEPKSLNPKEFKVVRIKTRDEKDNYIHLDIKVRQFNRKNFLFKLLTLPEFWRNFHFVSRKRKEDGAQQHPAYNLNKKLASFYTPGKSFSISSTVGTNKKEILDNVKADGPFSLYINSFAMHLFFTMPGLALPMTVQEQMWSSKQTPEMQVELVYQNQNEMPLICVEYSDDLEENKRILGEFSEDFSQREQNFSSFFEIGAYSGGQYLLTTANDFAFIYEANMVELFESITKFDEQTN